MANHQLVKWFIGLSSVAIFTGFIGLSGQYDQENQSLANKKTNTDDSNLTSQEAIRQEWQNSDPSTPNNDEVNQNSFQESRPSMESDQPLDSGNSNAIPSNSNRHGGRMRSHAS